MPEPGAPVPLRTVTQLADLLTADPIAPQSVLLRQAVVTATAATPNTVTLTIGGSGTPIPGVRYLAAYAPTVGDVVFVLQNSSDLLVLGKLA